MLLHELTEIRVIINLGAGVGHQKAAITLMQKLRELGFDGIFDVRYDEVWPCDFTEELRIVQNKFLAKNIAQRQAASGRTGRALQLLMPKFIPPSFDKPHVEAQIIDDDTLGIGLIRITRLPELKCDVDQIYDLPKTILSITAGDDAAIGATPEDSKKYPLTKHLQSWRSPEKYNSESFVCLQPTNWPRSRLLYLNSNQMTTLPHNATLTSNKVFTIHRNALSAIETRIFDLLNSSTYYTQFFCKSGWREPLQISSEILFNLLLEAHEKTIVTPQKPVIILLNQMMADAPDIDLTKTDMFHLNKNIITVYIGDIAPSLFEYLLSYTTFPPLLGGATLGLCENKGLPFLHADDSGQPLDQYDVQDKEMQTLHTSASEYFMKANKNKLEMCTAYLKIVCEKQNKAIAYHKDRQECFQQRPDAVKIALTHLNIDFGEKNDNTNAIKKIKAI